MENFGRHKTGETTKYYSTCIEINESSDKIHRSVHKAEVVVLGIDVTNCPRPVQFVIGVVGVFVFYIIYGYLLEKIFLIPGFRPYGWYLTWIQFVIYSFLGIMESYIFRVERANTPMKIYILIAFLTVCTMGLSNTSVGYLNYPTQVIFKCCKLIPTMIGGVLIQKIKYGLLDVTSVLLMVIGLVWFTLADNSVQPNFNMYGIILISLALCADGAIGNIQEKAMKTYSISSSEMVFYSYSIGWVMITVFLLLSQQLIPAFQVCSQNPFYIYGVFLLFSLSGYFGIQFILLLVKHFGALPAVTVSTSRKAVTIVLSFIFFQKPYTMMYLYSGMLVVLGIYLNLYSKNQNKWKVKLSNLLRCILNTIKGRRAYEETIV